MPRRNDDPSTPKPIRPTEQDAIEAIQGIPPEGRYLVYEALQKHPELCKEYMVLHQHKWF